MLKAPPLISSDLHISELKCHCWTYYDNIVPKYHVPVVFLRHWTQIPKTKLQFISEGCDQNCDRVSKSNSCSCSMRQKGVLVKYEKYGTLSINKAHTSLLQVFLHSMHNK